jgi:hypothetical protein
VHAVVRPRDRSSGRFKKRRPPPSTTLAGAIEVRIRTLERQLLEQQVPSGSGRGRHMLLMRTARD